MNTILLFLLSLLSNFTARHQEYSFSTMNNALLVEEAVPEFQHNDTIENPTTTKIVPPRRNDSQEGIYGVVPITSLFKIPMVSLFNQVLTTSLMLPDNQVATTWFSSYLKPTGGPDPVLMLRIFNEKGVPISDDIQVSPNEHQLSTSVSMAVMQDGFLVSWTGGTNIVNGSADVNCYQQFFSFNGTKNGSITIVNSLNTHDYSASPEVAVKKDRSELLFSWVSTPIETKDLVANGSDIRVQRFSSTLDKIGKDQVAHSYILGNQINPRPFYFSTGKSMVVWLDERSSEISNEYDIYAHLFDQNGDSLLPADIKISHDSKTELGMLSRQMVVDLDHDIALVFWGGNSLKTNRSSVFFRRMTANGTFLDATEIELNPTAGSDKYSAGASLVLDRFLLMYWMSEILLESPLSIHKIHGQLFSKNMTPLGEELVFKTGTFQMDAPYIPANVEGDLLFLTWEELEVNMGITINIFGQVFRLTPISSVPTQKKTDYPTHLPTFSPVFILTQSSPSTSSSHEWWKKPGVHVVALVSVTGCFGIILCIMKKRSNMTNKKLANMGDDEKKLVELMENMSK